MTSEWSSMTWREIREAATQESVVLVPIGCVETQGRCTPVGMEQILAGRLARDVAERTGALALPVVPFGHSDAFMNIPGTIFIRPDILTGYYFDVFSSVIRSGFEHILCIAYHIPNEPHVERAARLVRAETGVSIAWVNPGALAATYIRDLFPDPVAARGHGAEPGLSLMRYVCGIDVPSEDSAQVDGAKTYAGLDVQGAGLAFQGFPVGMPVGWEELYPMYGGFGDITLGSREIGEKLYGRLVTHLIALVDQLAMVDMRNPSARADNLLSEDST